MVFMILAQFKLWIPSVYLISQELQSNEKEPLETCRLEATIWEVRSTRGADLYFLVIIFYMFDRLLKSLNP